MTRDADRPLTNTRVRSIRPLVPPADLLQGHPLSERAAVTIAAARRDVMDVMRGRDDRLLVVAGPCSVHDPAAARDYAARLQAAAQPLEDALLVVMRAYFEKPRTGIGWKGLVNDPFIDESFDIDHGLRLARRFLLDLAERGLPAACEFLDPVVPQYLGDLVSLATIGARTVTSQTHRELASGLSAPVGFKNAIDGNVTVAVDAIRASAHPHRFLGVTHQGVAAIVETSGNDEGFVVLRGGHGGPSHDAESVARTTRALAAAGLPPHVMIDASHGNGGGDPARQARVVREVLADVADGARAVAAVMLESFLVEGRQSIARGGCLTYGQSITDCCLGWEVTERLLDECASAVRRRRRGTAGPSTSEVHAAPGLTGVSA